jgi:hypothetical protein
MADLDHNKGVFRFVWLDDGEGGIGRVGGKIVRSCSRLSFVQIGWHRHVPGNAYRTIREIECLFADIDKAQGLVVGLHVLSGLNEHELRFLLLGMGHRQK